MPTFLALVVAHLIGDFFLQNDWMAQNKSNPKSAAGYVHAYIHGMLALALVWLVTGAMYAAAWVLVAITITHWAIDLRSGLAWWRAFFNQTTDGKIPHAPAFFMLQDQAAHGIVIALVWFGLNR